jgi:hypothetical protein
MQLQVLKALKGHEEKKAPWVQMEQMVHQAHKGQWVRPVY